MVKILNQKNGNEHHIFIDSEISRGWGFSAESLRSELKDISPKDRIVVHINSIGGDVFEGIAIYNALKSHPGPVETIVESIAASVASIILLAGKTRKMYDNARVMVHNPFMERLSGNSEDIARMLEVIKDAEANITAIYKSNLSASEDTIKSWLKAETYFDAEEAKAAGFITDIIKIPNIEAAAKIDRLVAKFSNPNPTKGNDEMNFQLWLADRCKILGMSVDKLTPEQKADFQSQYDAIQARGTPPANPVPTPPPGNNTDPSARIREDAAREMERVEAINAAASELGDIRLNADTIKKEVPSCKATTVKGLVAVAIRENWSTERFELVARRATLVDVGSIGIHSHNTVTEVNPQAISCAIVKACQVVNRAKSTSGVEYGYEVQYPQQVLEASDQYKDVSLLSIFARIYQVANGHQYQGRLNTDGFISAAGDALRKLRMTGNTTWSSLNIFDDAANKVLWAAYNSVPTTWQEWVHPHSVPDFKTSNFYRMTMTGGYQQVGADGQLKHGGFSDVKFTASADTFGKMVGLSRTDLINDDLGAFNGIMSGLGLEGSKFLEELFYVHLMGQLTTLFPVDDSLKNYISGASSDLGVDGLTLASTKYSDQVDADYSPILQEPAILLVGTQDRIIAGELYTQSMLTGNQSANEKKRPDQNPHVGKYRPVVSGYLNNTAIKQRIVPGHAAVPGQTSNLWMLLGQPNAAMGGIVIGSFLNGKKTPTIQQGDPDFNVLGLQWRAFHDAGADNGDPKMGVLSKGAA